MERGGQVVSGAKMSYANKPRLGVVGFRQEDLGGKIVENAPRKPS